MRLIFFYIFFILFLQAQDKKISPDKESNLGKPVFIEKSEDSKFVRAQGNRYLKEVLVFRQKEDELSKLRKEILNSVEEPQIFTAFFKTVDFLSQDKFSLYYESLSLLNTQSPHFLVVLNSLVDFLHKKLESSASILNFSILDKTFVKVFKILVDIDYKSGREKQLLAYLVRYYSNFMVDFPYSNIVSFNALEKVSKSNGLYRKRIFKYIEAKIYNTIVLQKKVKNINYQLTERERAILTGFEKFFFDTLEWEWYSLSYLNFFSELLITLAILNEKNKYDTLIRLKEPFILKIFDDEKNKSILKYKDGIFRAILFAKAMGGYLFSFNKKEVKNEANLIVHSKVLKQLYFIKQQYGFSYIYDRNFLEVYELLNDHLISNFSKIASDYPLSNIDLLELGQEEYFEQGKIDRLLVLYKKRDKANNSFRLRAGISALRFYITKRQNKELFAFFEQFLELSIEYKKESPKKFERVFKSLRFNLKSILDIILQVLANDLQSLSNDNFKKRSDIEFQIKRYRDYAEDLGIGLEIIVQQKIIDLSDQVNKIVEGTDYQQLIKEIDSSIEEVKGKNTFVKTLTYLKGKTYFKVNQPDKALDIFRSLMPLLNEDETFMNSFINIDAHFSAAYLTYKKVPNGKEVFILLEKTIALAQKFLIDKNSNVKEKKIVEAIEKNTLFIEFALKSERVNESHENTLSKKQQAAFLEQVNSLLPKYDKYTNQYNNLIIVKTTLLLNLYRDNSEKIREVYNSLVEYAKKNFSETQSFSFTQQLTLDLLSMALILDDVNEIVRLLNDWLTLGDENLNYDNVFYYLSRILQKDDIEEPELSKYLERFSRVLLAKLEEKNILRKYGKDLSYLRFFLSRRTFLTGSEAEKEVQYEFFNDLIKNNKAGAVEGAFILYEYEKGRGAVENAISFLNYIIKFTQNYELESIRAKLYKMQLLIDSAKQEDVTYVFQAGSSFRFINLKNIYNKYKGKFKTVVLKRKFQDIIEEGFYLWFRAAYKLGLSIAKINEVKKEFYAKFPNSKWDIKGEKKIFK